MRTLFLSLLLFSLAHVAAAESFAGKVVNVTDGDTITVRDFENKPIRVRINGIEAPEKGRKPVPGQPYADQARRHMIELAKGKEAVVVWHKEDKYHRLVGKVTVDGVDVGLDQLRNGFAWVYVKYLGEVAPADRDAYLQAEATARQAQLGLWSDGDAAVPPWQWRKAMKEAKAETPVEAEQE